MRRSIVPALFVLVSLAVAGCKVTQEDVDYWTGTVKGPGKIVAVMLADKYEDELRAYAGVALVRMEPREDVDGVAELQAAVRQLPEETRPRLVDLMTPELIRLMRGEDAPQAGGDDQPVARRQVRAKDAAFLLVPYASEERRSELIEAVVDWFVVDFNARSLEGNYIAEQVVRQLGAPAASRLLGALNARIPQPALVKLAELIAGLGDRETKERGAARLVEIEREMESEEFLEWLKERLREQLRARMEEQGEGGEIEIDEERVKAAADLNRENFITLGALPAMKHLNGERVVQDRLLEIAKTASTEQYIAARRVKALQAMESGVRPDQVEQLLEIALDDETARIPVQSLGGALPADYAFDRIGDARSTSALPRLWSTFDSTEEWRLRWTVGKLILTLGGNDVVQDFFNRLDDSSYAREELFNYGERISQMRPPPTDFINTQLASRNWYDRVIALYFWEKRATADDLPRITALESDAAATSGPNWGDQTTVGKVAQAVARAVRTRLGQVEEPAEQAEDQKPSAEGEAE